MHYGKINPVDIANGPGVRVSLFVSGCHFHCPGCFNQETWDFDYGQEFTKETEDNILHMMNHSFIDGLSVLGGEPFAPENRDTVLALIHRVKQTYPDKSVWVFTGYIFESLLGALRFDNIDVVVDGQFIEDKKDISLQFRGSRNQRIILVQESLQKGVIALWKEKDIYRHD